MSISSSLSNAMSGLTAAARGAEVISSNVANANTEGYGRRDLVLSATTISGGVTVDSVTRNVNTAAITDRRLSEAALGESTVPLNFFKKIEDIFGLPGDPSSLSNSVNLLEQSLIAATGRPNDASNLSAIVASASQVAEKINDISNTIHEARTAADAEIGSQVSQINASLKVVQQLNEDIKRLSAMNADVSPLIDQRQVEIDKVSEFIPLKEVSRELNQVALVTQTGATLLDSNAAELVFTATPIITPDMTLGSGGISGLSIEGAASKLGDAFKSIEGGALAANFELRDEIAPAALIQVDALARNIIERFSGPSADPTLAIGQAGLFTDAGSDFDALSEENISARIGLNSLVDSSQGGDPTRLRDGLAAATPLPVGDNTMIIALREAIRDPQTPVTGQFTTNGGTSDLVNDVLSQFGALLRDNEAQLVFSTARATALRDIELQSGVSTDDELQKLLVVEQAYAANARIIQAVDEMLQSLLRI